MRTKDELFRAAQREIASRRQYAVMQAENARRAAFAAHPALARADDAQMRAGLALAKAAALGGDVEAARAALVRADEALAAATREAGYDENAFQPAYSCPRCHDTGMYNGNPCTCVAEIARRLRREEINAASPLGLCQFSTFAYTVVKNALLDHCRSTAGKGGRPLSLDAPAGEDTGSLAEQIPDEQSVSGAAVWLPQKFSPMKTGALPRIFFGRYTRRSSVREMPEFISK